ncbi:DUF4272 domain-containing protein [Methylobacterium sp. WL103]|uniref:DUF4272 domain-containing protein n=1 Tax=Methylobacterium sp. WL103 TaxID=2603891 RepID=UPI0011CBE61B|nr:DUF4272 domain-containing protein [Methylobacterium sp. WL103]TXN07333.1 DUF4272 domain-containing protein [Methylobacterium sp. WL103]
MSLLRRLFGRGALAAAPGETLLVNAYATVRELPLLPFPHSMLGRRDLTDPELPTHLDGFIGYVMGRGDGRMTAGRYHLWRHLQRVRNHASFEISSAELPRLEAWALDANAVLFLPDGSVRSPDMGTLMSSAGESDPSAVLPHPADALARRARSLGRLKGLNPSPLAGMPPSIGEAELVLRTPAEVLRRSLALFHLAARAEAHASGADSIPGGRPDLNRIGYEALTPREREQIADGCTFEDASALTWRYEAANVLAWSLGLEGGRIEDSGAQIDVNALWRSLAPLAVAGGIASAPVLRPAGEILDALDRTWREHWVVRQAREKELPLEGVDGDVVAERHVAFNWLTGFQNVPDASWDDIDTPT